MLPIRARQLWVLLLVLAPPCARAQSKVYPSPDGALRAVVIPLGNGPESRVEIRRADGRLRRWKSLASVDGEHGQGIAHAAWSADGQYFVFNAEHAGGHQPWHRATYFYRRRENRCYGLDDFIGPVTSDFTLAGRHAVQTTRFNFRAREEKEPITVRLDRLRRGRR
jgi:hypothetical protein